jgi:hypothetical protein
MATIPEAGFTLANVVYTAIGASVFWAKAGRTGLRPYLLPELVRACGVKGKSRTLVEFLLFVITGCVVGIGVVSPVNATQALTAGFAWTSFFTYPERGTQGKA